MATKKTKPGYDLIVSILQKDKEASYADIAASAKRQKLLVYPIMYGRAKAALGLVKSKPRGQGKRALAKKGRRKKGAKKGPAKVRAAGTGKRGPGRPRKDAAVSYDSLENIVAAVKGNEQARVRYQDALAKIQAILASVLD
jgi:hypothetical protein